MNQLRLLLLVMALVLAGLFGWRQGDRPAGGWRLALWPFATQPVKPAGPWTLAQARANVEERFAAIPAYSSYFNTLRADFPAEYQRINDGLAQKYASAEALSAPPEVIDRAFFQAAHALRQSHGILAAKAENPELERISRAQGSMMLALSKRDPRLCVDFFYGGADPDFYQAMSENRGLAAEFAASWLDAIANGKQASISRDDPDDADVQMFDDALLAKGLSRAEIDALLENKVANPPLQDDALCRAGILYFSTLASLPEGPRIKLMARILSLAARS